MMRLMRFAMLSTALVALSPGFAHAASPEETGKRNADCVNACLSTQRHCVTSASTLADRSKCSDDNATCSTKCPLPGGGPKH